MNIHACLQLALNDCDLSRQLSGIDWISNDEAIHLLKLVLSFKADDISYSMWQQAFKQ